MTTTHRRFIFGTLVLATIAALFSTILWTFLPGGLSWQETGLMICFFITLPWTAIGFWNAVIGFGLMRFTKNPAERVFPALGQISGREVIKSSTALAMCIRNEDVDQVSRNLTAMVARLVAAGEARHFHLYILSDSTADDVIAREEFVFERLRREWGGRFSITYRRRETNPGFKSGNIRDFCDRWGADHDFMLTLDADSVMSASTILRMVRLMQANDKLGILQSLVVGLPSESAFTRVFQFGMRLGMRSFTLGSAWWQADCGPYWGHNALIRLKPFIDHCELPVLPGKGPLSGHILSHDQVEAVYMRRAGYECRVIAEETGSYEENPPHLLEFIRRDLRWCRGNMQYFWLLREKGLLPTSRIQLFLAILMFIGAPAWLGFIAIATSGMVFAEQAFDGFRWGPGLYLFATIMFMVFAPKIVTVLDVLMRPALRRSYGGCIAVMVSALGEIVFSMLLAPIMAIAETIYLAGLPFGRSKGWAEQNRQAHSLPIGAIARYLWPQNLFGVVGLGSITLFKMVTLTGLIACLPVFIGPFLAIPFAYVTAHTAVGAFFTRLGLWQLPEETTPTVTIRALNLPALAMRARRDEDRRLRGPLTTEEILTMKTERDDRLVA